MQGEELDQILQDNYNNLEFNFKENPVNLKKKLSEIFKAKVLEKWSEINESNLNQNIHNLAVIFEMETENPYSHRDEKIREVLQKHMPVIIANFEQL